MAERVQHLDGEAAAGPMRRRLSGLWRLLPAALIAGLAVTACPPGIDDPESFSDDCPPGFSAESLFVQRCSGAGCHGGSDDLGADLELTAPDVLSRLINVPSVDCTGKLLVSDQGSEGSYLIEKVAGTPTCGGRMPLGADALSAREVQCLRDWIDANVGGTLPDASVDAGSDAGDAGSDAGDAGSDGGDAGSDGGDAGMMSDGGDASMMSDGGDASMMSDGGDASMMSDGGDASMMSDGGPDAAGDAMMMTDGATDS